MLWQCVDNESKEECKDGEDDKSNDVLLVLPPDEEDEGLHWVDEPGEAGGGTSGGMTGNVFYTWIIVDFHQSQHRFKLL